jgi:hypothetical protein
MKVLIAIALAVMIAVCNGTACGATGKYIPSGTTTVDCPVGTYNT